MITLHDVEQGTQEWLELRQGLYTGSNADKLLRYATSHKIVNGKTSNYSIAEITGFKGNFWTKRGHVLEDQAVNLYQKITGIQVQRIGLVTNDKYPGCGYSPDGLPPMPLLEIKCFDMDKHLALINGDIPFKILAQIHFGLLITERPFAHLVPYNPEFANKDNRFYDPSKALKIITIKADRDVANNFRKILMPKEVAIA